MVILVMFYCAVVLVEFSFFFFMIYRANVAYKNRDIILDAIYAYQLDELHRNREWQVDYEDMEVYERTVWRLWDFGYTRILPKEKYEIVKEYITYKGEKEEI